MFWFAALIAVDVLALDNDIMFGFYVIFFCLAVSVTDYTHI